MVLEIGGGVGEIHLELLRRGAASATALELSSAYDEEAARLLAEAGLTDRVHRRLVDIATDPAAVEAADVVVLHRVVCCYPDYAKLLGAAAEHTRRAVVFSHPPRNVVTRAVVATQNLFLRLGGREFRTFAHPPAAMRAVLAEHGPGPSSPRADGCGGSAPRSADGAVAGQPGSTLPGFISPDGSNSRLMPRIRSSSSGSL